MAAFITFVTFVVFAGICLLFSLKSTAIAVVRSRLDYCNSLYHNIALMDISKLQRVQKWFGKGSYPMSLCPLTQYHLNHCIGSLSDIALFLRSVQLPTKHFYPSNLRIYIHCSLLQDSPSSFNHLILIYFLFPVLRQMSELELFQLLHRRCGTHSLLVLNV